MIYVQRTDLPDTEKQRRFNEEAQHLLREFEKTHRLNISGNDVRLLLKKSGFHEALNALFRNKCSFCETKEIINLELSAFRPIKNVLGVSDNKSGYRDGYWWLLYDWENYHLACRGCSSAKRGRFPIEGSPALPLRYGNELDAERPLLLDPCKDIPQKHLRFDLSGRVLFLTERGRVTIETFNLNRENLVRRRIEKIEQFEYVLRSLTDSLTNIHPESLIIKTIKYLSHFFDVNSEYIGVINQIAPYILEKCSEPGATIISEYLVKNGFLEILSLNVPVGELSNESYSVESAGAMENSQDRQQYLTSAKFIEQIEIINFRAIKEITLTFPTIVSLDVNVESESEEQGPSCMMLLGENGTGKSSILQAVALTLMGEEHANNLGLKACNLIRHGAESATVTIRLTGSPEPQRLTLSANSDHITITPSQPLVLLLGYGATRLLPNQTGTGGETHHRIRVKNLFDPTAPLQDAQTWLAGLEEAKFEEAASVFRDALPLPSSTRFFRENGETYLEAFGQKNRLNELSDGFQSALALCSDILISLLDIWESRDAAEGIVLIDELEVHLHPRWKREVVGRLRRAFPSASFLMTTHDPLCLYGMFSGEIARLDRQADGVITVDQTLPAVNDLRPDQILASEHFNLEEVRGPIHEQKKVRYLALVQMLDRTLEEQEEFERLRRDLDQAIQPGVTPLEREARWIIQQAVTKGIQPNLSTNPDLLLNTDNFGSETTNDDEPEIQELVPVIPENKDQLHDEVMRQLTSILMPEKRTAKK